MSNQFGFTCPNCGDTDSLDIAARIWVRVMFDGTDANESRIGDHEWSDDSAATCDCGWEGAVGDLMKECGS